MIELFPNIDHLPLRADALCPPDRIDEALAQIQGEFRRRARNFQPGEGIPVLLFETPMP
jgi:hypothetical protein